MLLITARAVSKPDTIFSTTHLQLQVAAAVEDATAGGSCSFTISYQGLKYNANNYYNRLLSRDPVHRPMICTIQLLR